MVGRYHFLIGVKTYFSRWNGNRDRRTREVLAKTNKGMGEWGRLVHGGAKPKNGV